MYADLKGYKKIPLKYIVFYAIYPVDSPPPPVNKHLNKKNNQLIKREITQAMKSDPTRQLHSNKKQIKVFKIL